MVWYHQNWRTGNATTYNPLSRKNPEWRRLAKWAWEFLRRSPRYDDVITKHQQKIVSSLNSPWEMLDVAEDFGILHPMPPSQDFTDDIAKYMMVMAIPTARAVKGQGASACICTKQPGSLLCKLNILVPIGVQLDWLEKQAENAKDEIERLNENMREDPEYPGHYYPDATPVNLTTRQKITESMYPKFLRLLDAHADLAQSAGLSGTVVLDQMVRTITKPGIAFVDKEDRRRCKDDLAIAAEWRDRGYRILTCQALASISTKPKSRLAKVSGSLETMLANLLQALQERDSMPFSSEMPFEDY